MDDLSFMITTTVSSNGRANYCPRRLWESVSDNQIEGSKWMLL